MRSLMLFVCLWCAVPALAAQYSVSVSPVSADFGTQYLNTASIAQVFTITNTGLQNLTFSSFSIRGSGFRWSEGTGPQTLLPGDSVTLTVRG